MCISCGNGSVRITNPSDDARKCVEAYAKAKTDEQREKAIELTERYEQAYAEAAYKVKFSDKDVLKFMDCYRKYLKQLY